MYPKLIVNLKKLRHNLNFLLEQCHGRGITASIVTKVFCADERIVELIDHSAVDFIADSRVLNLKSLNSSKQKVLLRISMPSEAEDVVRYADISMQSEIAAIQRLAKAAYAQGKKHRVVLMIDLGDLREGIFFKDRPLILETARAVVESGALELYGLGTNLTCYGGILPDENNMGILCDIARAIRKEFGIELPMVSGGNSSSMTMLMEGRLPAGINNLRLGESFVLSNDTSTGLPIDGMHSDAFILEAEIVELQAKPSKPIGKSGMNAFGETVQFEDRGQMLRAIIAIGRQDVDPASLKCLDENAEILGASSDHLIVDLTKSNMYNVGDTISFVPGYGALLRLCTSKYVYREYVN